MNRSITLIFAAAVIFLTGCGPQNVADVAGDPLQAWIDAPLDGSALPVATYTIIFSGASFGDPIGNFEIYVNGVKEGAVGPLYQNNDGDAQYSYAQFDWLPPAPGNYLLQVRAQSGGLLSEFASANVVVGELITSDDAVPLASEEPVGEDVLVAIPSQNVNCREGNSSQFDIADTLFMGERYSPNGRGFDNLWVRFLGPVNLVQCWVFADNLQLLLNEQPVDIVDVSEPLLPFVPYPTLEPTATFTPEPEATQPPPQCSDGLDNDGDGRIDFGNAAAIAGGTADRECTSPTDNDESVR